MRCAVSTLFFLAMVPVGFMATQVRASGHRTSSVQATTPRETQERLLLRGEPKGGREGRRRRKRRDDDNDDMTDSPDVPSPTPANMEILLDLHNSARCLHDADPLTYSNMVASSAMVRHVTALCLSSFLSSDCGSFYHSESEDRHGYGENLYLCWGSGSGTCYSPEKAMNGLYEDEIQVDAVTEYGGHATQILWKSTTQLGCAVATCEKQSYTYTYLVCQYNPPPTLWQESQLSTGHPIVAAFQNQTATVPGRHGIPFEKPRTAAPTQRADATPTAHAAAGTRPPTTAARGDTRDYLRTQKVCFAHAFSGNCRRPGNCQWQHEPFPAAFYKDVASSRRPGNSNPRRRLAAMTETQ
eukprot:jgi/Undpi1/10996/HiC_scaffold_30.g13297.m1